MKTEWSPRFLLDYTHEFYSSYGYSFIKIVLCYCQKGSLLMVKRMFDHWSNIRCTYSQTVVCQTSNERLTNYLIILLSVDTAVASLHGSKDLLLTH